METPLPDNPSASRSESSLGRCPACGYIVHGLPQPRCPECGESFDPVLLAADEVRAHLLAWERPELGGRPRRFVKTVFAACVKPWSHFDHARQRTSTPIANAEQLIRWCLIAAMFCHVAGYVVDKMIFFGRLIFRGASLERSLHIVVSTSREMWASELAVVVPFLLSIALVFVLLLLLLLVITERRGVVIRRIDAIALVCPAVVFAESLVVVTPVLFHTSLDLYFTSIAAIVVVRPAFLALVGWFYCRRVLLLERLHCVLLAISYLILAMVAERVAFRSAYWFP